jgi:hypothetical protein
VVVAKNAIIIQNNIAIHCLIMVNQSYNILVNHNSMTILKDEDNIASSVFSYFNKCDTENFQKAHEALCMFYSYWKGTPCGARSKKFTVGEDIASEMLCEALGLPRGARTNKPLADLVQPFVLSHEIKCLGIKKKSTVYGSQIMLVLTRTAYTANIESNTPEDALNIVINNLNRLIDERTAETPNGILIHYFLYDKDKVIHFAKPLVKLDPAKLAASWKKKGQYSTLLVTDRDTGSKVFNFTVNGAKIQFFTAVPDHEDCAVFPLTVIGKIKFISDPNAKQKMTAAAVFMNNNAKLN